ncbi:diaminopimelate epimerase [Pacificimonas flava]|uniref:Diaminopimelate epimerase n=2 Tax=Pacificimonas TaxID=1960290 RepID=A0A219B1N3_9SPHN|nr:MULTISPECIES: diaminopimelate epimerase [Pacificimonas]MBZ6380066.1 diaminopimelate epimerase [Pacificimonas aurantium]OWV32033.1 diaminopimelate epimerase [Pacificimonas flava]
MARPFIKMHGLGNDFVVFDARDDEFSLSADQVRAVADRRTGVGCDQLFVMEPSDKADVFMRIYNADGSEVAACGNGARCIARLVGDGRETVRIETLAGLIEGRADGAGAALDMGAPKLGWQEIPLAYAMDTLEMPVGWGMLERPVGVNMGNPHAVFFVERLDDVPITELGPEIETDPLFPEKVNVGVAEVLAPDAVRLKVWERGAGLTQACGTGACAAAVAAMRRKLTERKVTVHLPGGALEIEWREDGHVLMTGPAEISFTGQIDL